MKIQALLSAACVLLTAVPSALAEEHSHAVAKPIEAFEDVLVSAGLYDPEDEDSEDMGDFVVKKDRDGKSKKSNRRRDGKSKKSNRRRDGKSKKSNRRRRRRRSRSSRSYRNGMCRNPRRSDRKLCDELEEDFCDSRRDFRQNERFCKNLGFHRSVTDEEWALMAETVSEFLPEDYAMLIDEVANNLESSEDSEDDEDSEDLYDSEDEEDEDSEDEDSEDMGDFVAKKDDSKKSNKKTKKSNKKKSKKSNRRRRKSRSRRNRRRSNCDNRKKSDCKKKSSCEWVDWRSGKDYCRRYTKDSSEYDFESASEDFYSEY